MTRVAVLSDIHGNLAALRAVLDDVHRLRPDMTVCAGDLVVYGPFPNECVNLVRSNKITTVTGNRDWAVGRRQSTEAYAVPARRDRAAETAIYEWTTRVVTEPNRLFLSALPRRLRLHLGRLELLLVHGTIRSPFEYVRPDDDPAAFAELAELSKADIVVGGHTHVPFRREVGETLFLNAGSVGWPKDGRPDAGYVLIDVSGRDVRVEFRRVAYPVEETIAAIHRFDLPDALGRALAFGTEMSAN